jgi:hypothetical protein
MTVSRLRLTASAAPVRRPTVVRLSWAGGTTPSLTVAADGTVTLPAPARARAFRLTVVAARFPPTATARQRQADAVGIGAISVPGLPRPSVPRSGPLHAGCGTVALDVAGHRVAMKVTGTVADLDAGLPLRARACTPPARIGAGLQEIRALPGVFAVDLLQLRSPAPRAAAPVIGGGTVTDPGNIGNNTVDGVRVSLHGPSWLVLGESYDAGWRATCNGRSLASPQRIDGYGSGWPAPANCRRVAFTFAPQSEVDLSYYVSGLVCALLLLVVLAGVLLRRRLPVMDKAAGLLLPEPPAHPRPLLRAAAISLLVSVPVAAVFALRAGAVTFPLLALILWRGVRPSALTRAAVVLLGLAVPLTYAIVSPHNPGGYSFTYATKLIAAHWMGVAAILLLGLAAASTIAGARRQRRGGPPPPAPTSLARPPDVDAPSPDAPPPPSPPPPTDRPARVG